MVECPFTHDGGWQAARALLARTERPTALLVDNNIAGGGAFRALVDSGLRLGEDMSLIVYDGVPPNLAHPYRVTAVVQPTGHASGAHWRN